MRSAEPISLTATTPSLPQQPNYGGCLLAELDASIPERHAISLPARSKTFAELSFLFLLLVLTFFLLPS
jgi:hypothetical protein